MPSNSEVNLAVGAGGAIDRAALDEVLALARRERARAVRAVVGLVAGWLRARLIEPLERARQRRVDLDTLLRLDDRTLADIGLERGQIRAVVYGGATLYRPTRRPALRPAADAAPAAPAAASGDLRRAA